MRCDLQIFSGCVCHLEQLHAQSPFLFPIVFSINKIFSSCALQTFLLPLTHNLAKVPPSAVPAFSRPSPSPSLFALVDLITPAVSVAKHDVSAGLPQPFSSKQQKKKMPTFFNLLVFFPELSGRCGASSRRSCGNVTFGVDVGILCIKRSVSSVTKKHEEGRSAKKGKVQCNNAYGKKPE